LRALRQTRREAGEAHLSLLEYVRGSRDPNVKMVLFEDTAALAGIVLALVGIIADQVTGSAVFDPAASVMIGVLLVGVAVWMGRDASSLLIGAAARPQERETLEAALNEFAEIDQVVELLTMVLGPSALLVAARVDLAEDLSSDDIERVANELDEAIRRAVPDVTEVFLDATPGASRTSGERTARR
jgi:divalent metal cation (Fe/Co/Zn/Cd) transporter